MKKSFLQNYRRLLLAVLIGGALGAALGYFGQCTSGTCPLTSTWWRGALYGGLIGLLFGATSKPATKIDELSEKPNASRPATPQATETHEHPDAGK